MCYVYNLYTHGRERKGMMNEVMRMEQALTAPEVGALVQRFIKFAQVSDKTTETYLKALRQMMGYFSLNGITQPTEENLIDWKNWLIRHEENGKEIKHAPATVNLYVTACRRFFGWLEREGVYRNVAKYLKGVKLDKEPAKDYLTASQVRQVLAEADRETVQSKRDYALLVLAITGGLRTIEIQRADVKDLTVRGENAVLYLQGKGSNQKTKFVIVPEQAEKAIRDYLKARGTKDGTEPLFASLSNNNGGGRMSTRAISGVIKTYMKRAGFDSDRLTAHSCRHTSITLALLAGADIREAQQYARHADINTTLIYAHGLDAEKNSCSKRVAEAIF